MFSILRTSKAVTAAPVRMSASVRCYGLFSKEAPRIRIGSTAPDFDAQTTKGPINFHKFLDGKWTVLFSHPADFTPVCTTELGAFAKAEPAFNKLGVQLIGLSADSIDNHKQWEKDIEEVASAGAPVNYPIISDVDRDVAFLYDMVDQAGFEKGKQATTIRNVFVIDPEKKVRLFIVYPASTGRNISEVLRVVQALQEADKRGVVTPADWVSGEDVIIPPSVSNEDARKKFGEFNEVKPYLRYAKSN